MTKTTTIKKILIANRGEIAIRIARAARKMGIATVAVYSESDRESHHRYFCDEAVYLGGMTAAESYLDFAKLKAAIEDSGADAVHPGYGFLSENSDFCEMIEKMPGVEFIGPTSSSMKKMGDKISARQLADENNIPCTPGCTDPLVDVESCRKEMQKIGLPCILKAAMGGGGRGMQIVSDWESLDAAFEKCKREAKSYFGSDAVFCEKYITKPRHIEVQVLFDAHGNGVYLYERDCSVQRKHQKILEEAPSPYLSHEDRERLGKLAVSIGKACGYRGAGTVEFISESPTETYFMEMNTRIQVEHPVTEMITGIDLIEWQIRVASGEELGFSQKDIKIHGHAIEARINAEDPKAEFMPSTGKIDTWHQPSGPRIRVDTFVKEGTEINAYFDSMIAKFIAWGPSRDEALDQMLASLQEFSCIGDIAVNGGEFETNASFIEFILTHPDFRRGDFNTSFVPEILPSFLDKLDEKSEASDDFLNIASALAATKLKNTDFAGQAASRSALGDASGLSWAPDSSRKSWTQRSIENKG